MKVIVHRLNSNSQNTIRGLKESLANDFRRFEVDIRKCGDKIVLCHDYLYEPSETLDDLECFLDYVNKQNNIEIYFDIKGTDNSIVYALKEMAKSFNVTNVYLFQSFNIDILLQLKALNLPHKRGLIVSGYRPIHYSVLYDIDYLCIEEEYVNKYIDYDIPKYLFTVNSAKMMEYYKKIGIKGIFTDVPHIF